jgi:hypothetical protein
MQISTLLPGASYSSGSFVIPFSAINAILTTPITSEDSFEKLLFGLLEVVYARRYTADTVIGDIEQSSTTISVGGDNRSVQ